MDRCSCSFPHPLEHDARCNHFDLEVACCWQKVAHIVRMSHRMGSPKRKSLVSECQPPIASFCWIFHVRDVGVAGSDSMDHRSTTAKHIPRRPAQVSRGRAFDFVPLHFADRVELDESFRSDSLFSPTSATICGQRTL